MEKAQEVFYEVSSPDIFMTHFKIALSIWDSLSLPL